MTEPGGAHAPGRGDGPEGPEGPGDPEPEGEAREAQGTKEGVHRCDLCGAPMLERHCKLVCPACGYQRDCSDP